MARIYSFPINYMYGRSAFSVDSMGNRTGAPEIQDNDPSTSSDASTFIIETHGETRTTNSHIDHIFMISENVDSYTIRVPSGRGSGTGVTNAAVPDTALVRQKQYVLPAFGPLMATEIQIDVTGTNTKVYEIAAMRTLTAFTNVFQVINPSVIDRGKQVRRNIKGNLIVTSGVEGRMKRQTDYTGIFHGTANDLLADRILQVLDENDPFFWVEDFTRFPERCYSATLNGGVATSYVGQQFNQRQLQFSVLEL